MLVDKDGTVALDEHVQCQCVVAIIRSLLSTLGAFKLPP